MNVSDFLYPSFEAVMEAHAMIIRTTGGQAGMVSSSNLKYILEIVQDIGEELDDVGEAIKIKATYLMYRMIVSHPFLDGNKRSAFEVTKRFLELNNWIFMPRAEEAFSKLILIAGDRLDQDDVEEWIGKNLRQGGN